MGRCETCGNDYDKTFELILDETRHTFDSFECAIEALAPKCSNCNCKIIGHGVETDGEMFCCAHCAKHTGKSEVRDRVDTRVQGSH